MGANDDIDHINDTMNKKVAEKTDVASKDEVTRKLKLNDQTAYIEADAFIGNPNSLLGRVIEIRKQKGKCPETLNDPDYRFDFSNFAIPGVKVDENSILKAPVLRSSLIVNKEVSVNVGFLNYLSAQLDAKSFFSLMVFDQAAALADVHDNSWHDNVKKWEIDNQNLIDDPDVCYLFAVIGFVQKNIVRKKYIKYDGSAKGGAYGVNISGEISTSTEEYSLDIRFGLTPTILKRPDSKLLGIKSLVAGPTEAELRLFGSATGATISEGSMFRK